MTESQAKVPSDRELLDRLGRIAETIDPVPDEVIEMGRAALGMRDLEAQLLREVDLGGGELAAVRHTATSSRLLFFEFDDLAVDLEVVAEGPLARVLGVVTDPAGVPGRSVTIESVGASHTAEVDPSGRFMVRWLPTGLVRLRLDAVGHPSLVTKWFELG
ncbi:MAG: carboxypeptidase-like regulatory domain-containing protein [Micrococcales bacterium]|nr:carboxypeptidase-like regulatory domain-containing protein [Micrococcales bacterium]